MSIEKRLKELGIVLPEPPAAVAAYVPSLRAGDLVFTSGQLPFSQGELQYRGIMGKDLSLDEGAAAARLCMLNALAVLGKELGNLDRIEKIVRLVGYVRCTDDFADQPGVLNGASQLLLDIFGRAGRHTRMALGVNALPLGASVELALTVLVRK